MRNSETLRSGAAEAYSALYGGENTAYELLSSAAARLGDCVRFDNALEGISSELSEALYGVEDAARELSSYLEGLDFDPAELAETEERLDLIRKLLTKYGSTVEEVLKYADDAREEIDKIEFSDVHEQKLEEDIKKADEKVYKLAGKISDRRKKAAEKLCAGVLKTLKELDMGNVRFEAKCEKTELTATGADKIEFLVATSSSQPLGCGQGSDAHFRRDRHGCFGQGGAENRRQNEKPRKRETGYFHHTFAADCSCRKAPLSD